MSKLHVRSIGRPLAVDLARVRVEASGFTAMIVAPWSCQPQAS
jgi:hypothetical protein